MMTLTTIFPDEHKALLMIRNKYMLAAAAISVSAIALTTAKLEKRVSELSYDYPEISQALTEKDIGRVSKHFGMRVSNTSSCPNHFDLGGRSMTVGNEVTSQEGAKFPEDSQEDKNEPQLNDRSLKFSTAELCDKDINTWPVTFDV